MSSELASSFAQEDIPIKLRCATCSRLVIDALRLPCCEQSICGTCQDLLPESCPVCMHTPLAGEDCKPNKALRLTVKAFLKNEEKKREKDRICSLNQVSEDTTVDASSTKNDVSRLPASQEHTKTAEEPSISALESSVPDREEASDPSLEKLSVEGSDSIIAGKADEAEVSDTALNLKMQQVENGHSKTSSNKNPKINATAHASIDEENAVERSPATEIENSSMVYSHSTWDGNGGYNPMMGMQFPGMMGLASMGMDPSMISLGMFGGFNGQGMSMNGMSGMNMINGYDGMYGWNGMQGGFGSGSVYYPVDGYNRQGQQGRFSAMPVQQFPMNNYQQNRFRGQGRGRGGIGRDQGNSARWNHEMGQQSLNSQHLVEESESISLNKGESGDQPHAIDTSDQVEAKGVASTAQIEHMPDSASDPPNLNEDSYENDPNVEGQAKIPSACATGRELLRPISTIESSDIFDAARDVAPIMMDPILAGTVPKGPAAQYGRYPNFGASGRVRGAARGLRHGMYELHGSFRGRGGRSGPNNERFTLQNGVAPIGQGVIGAPTGPKAMRSGTATFAPNARGDLQPVNRNDVEAVDRSSRPASQTDNVTTQPRSRSRSRSSSKQRSVLLSDTSQTSSQDEHEAGKESSIRDDSRKERPSMYDDDVRQLNKNRHRHRDAPSELRSGHSKRRERSGDRSMRRSTSRERRHRRHRLASVERNNEDTEIGEVRHRSRRGLDHDRRLEDRESRRRSHQSRRDQSTSESHRRSHIPSGEHRNHDRDGREFKIKDGSRYVSTGLREYAASGQVQTMDVHALERESRNRERQLKEQQRRQSIYKDESRKRGRDTANEHDSDAGNRNSSRRKLQHDSSGRQSSRRTSHKYDDQENDEDRDVRVESEREASRWS